MMKKFFGGLMGGPHCGGKGKFGRGKFGEVKR
jgi:hypothetical protein